MVRDIFTHLIDIVAEFFRKEEVWWLLVVLAILGVVGASVPNLGEVSIVRFLRATWWLWLFLVLLPASRSLWLFWRQELFKRSIRFVLLEIKMPREVAKSPQAMEQVLHALHSLRNFPGDIEEKYWVGEVPRWFALEIVSFGGEIHFYVRVYAKQRNLVEAAFFSYYTDVEVVEVDDYISRLPRNAADLYARGLGIWGTEMVLDRPDAFPIKSYVDFEHVAEEKQFDPISTFLEVLSKVRQGEIVGIQILIAPGDPGWHRRWEKLVEELRRPSTAKVSSGKGPQGELAGLKETLIARSPGQTDILEAVENNLSKPAFDTLIRFIYLSPIELFYDSYARRGLTGAFNQYSSLNLNRFRQNYTMSTRTRIWHWPHVAPRSRNVYRQQRLLYNYRNREVPPETWMGRLMTSYLLNWNFSSRRFKMNVEGIATLFHPPTMVVLTGPHMVRVESRKTGPPAGLAIFGDEKEMDRYL